MTITIDRLHYELLRAYSEEAYPYECCGFLLGETTESGRRIVSTMPAQNAREPEAQHHRFLIKPEVFLRMERFARERNLDVIGFYHSHPNGAAQPSQYDAEHSWPWYIYIIVAVEDGEAKDLRAWSLEDDRRGFEDHEIEVVENTKQEVE